MLRLQPSTISFNRRDLDDFEIRLEMRRRLRLRNQEAKAEHAGHFSTVDSNIPRIHRGPMRQVRFGADPGYNVLDRVEPNSDLWSAGTLEKKWAELAGPRYNSQINGCWEGSRGTESHSSSFEGRNLSGPTEGNEANVYKEYGRIGYQQMNGRRVHARSQSEPLHHGSGCTAAAPVTGKKDSPSVDHHSGSEASTFSEEFEPGHHTLNATCRKDGNSKHASRHSRVWSSPTNLLYRVHPGRRSLETNGQGETGGMYVGQIMDGGSAVLKAICNASSPLDEIVEDAEVLMRWNWALDLPLRPAVRLDAVNDGLMPPGPRMHWPEEAQGDDETAMPTLNTRETDAELADLHAGTPNSRDAPPSREKLFVKKDADAASRPSTGKGSRRGKRHDDMTAMPEGGRQRPFWGTMGMGMPLEFALAPAGARPSSTAGSGRAGTAPIIRRRPLPVAEQENRNARAHGVVVVDRRTALQRGPGSTAASTSLEPRASGAHHMADLLR